MATLEGTGKSEWIGSFWSKLAELYFSKGQHKEAERAALDAKLALKEIESATAKRILESIDQARAARKPGIR